MLPSTPPYRGVLATPHKRFFRIDVTDIDGETRASDLRPFSGDVTASATDRVTRSAQFTIGPKWYPTTSTDPLSPEFAVVHIQAGIQYGDGSTETFPVFTGRVDTVRLQATGEAVFDCYDLSQDVVAFNFEQPRTTTQGTVLAEIEALILEALPQATFGTHTVTDTPTPRLTWETDRGQALDDLAQSVGGRWYALGDGSFVVRGFSYEEGPIVATYTDGPQGVVIGADIARTRSGAFNSIIVESERTDGSDPIRVPARVTDPANPLLFTGQYGKVNQIMSVQTPLSSSQAQTLATTQLNASSALREQWTWSMVPDMTLELGDTVALGYRDRTGVQIADAVVYPLDHQRFMTVTGRAGVKPQ